jgi:hypothetical protein
VEHWRRHCARCGRDTQQNRRLVVAGLAFHLGCYLARAARKPPADLRPRPDTVLGRLLARGEPAA